MDGMPGVFTLLCWDPAPAIASGGWVYAQPIGSSSRDEEFTIKRLDRYCSLAHALPQLW